MKIIFVHERYGALGGAEANALTTAREFKKKGHDVALLHGHPTGKGEDRWAEVFSSRYALNEPPETQVARALNDFAPDLVYVHKMADLRVIEALVRSGLPLVRMVHDHDIYCMRS